jgi:hypothetical protein
VYFPLRYHRSNRGLEGRHWYAQLTRFMPDEVRARFELRSTYVDATDARDSTLATTGSTSGVDALLAGLWSD